MIGFGPHRWICGASKLPIRRLSAISGPLISGRVSSVRPDSWLRLAHRYFGYASIGSANGKCYGNGVIESVDAGSRDNLGPSIRRVGSRNHIRGFSTAGNSLFNGNTGVSSPFSVKRGFHYTLSAYLIGQSGSSSASQPIRSQSPTVLNALNPKRNFHCTPSAYQSPQSQPSSGSDPIRSQSPITPEPKIPPIHTKLKSSRLFRYYHYSVLVVGVVASVIGALLLAFFIYDATTYDVPPPSAVDVPSAALNPDIGGPKNLPICSAYLDGEESDTMVAVSKRPRLVILGTGWGSVSLLKDIDPNLYNITVISPVNYFLFTPMLPSATVGTLELRSLAEPMRKVCRGRNAHFLEATAEDVDFENRLVEVGAKDTTGKLRSFYVPYDKLVIATGCTSNTHGVEGLQYCNFLKSIQDARLLRNKIVGNLEKACLPTTTPEERKRLLSFVICGGGPTGVELAAEISDMLNEDLAKQYPQLLRNQVSVHILQSRSHILNTYDEKISNYAMDRFKNDSIDVLVNSRVARVEPNKVIFSTKNPDEERTYSELPFGVCIWSTGVAQNPLTKKLTQKLGAEHQPNKRAIETDDHLRVFGTPQGEVYAIGDCATVRTDTAKQTLDILKHQILARQKVSLTGPNRISDIDLKNTRVTVDEVAAIAKVLRRKHPLSQSYLNEIREQFKEFSREKDSLTIEELTDMMSSVKSRVTSLPATAQRASQQGQYLARKFTKLARAAPTLRLNDLIDGDMDDTVYRPFDYHHMGSLAYVSNAAVFDLNGKAYFGGLIAMYLWRGVYFAQTVSFRTRALLFIDWLKRGLFGRDLADISLSEADFVDET